MQQVINALKRELTKLNKLIRTIESSRIEVEGTLEVINNKEKGVMLYKYVDKDTPLEYLNSRKVGILAPLSQKRYNSELYRTVKARAKAIEKSLKPLEGLKDKEDLLHIYEDLPQEIKGYVTPILDDDEEYARKWQNQWVPQNDIPMKTKYKTLRGDFVRSKSEALIADRLYANGIPYHCEPLMGGKGKSLMSPDFMALNKRIRKTFFWEHFGMMDDATYCNRSIDKIVEYSRKGHLIGTDFIATFETSEHPLDTRLVERIIEGMLK